MKRYLVGGLVATVGTALTMSAALCVFGDRENEPILEEYSCRELMHHYASRKADQPPTGCPMILITSGMQRKNGEAVWRRRAGEAPSIVLTEIPDAMPGRSIVVCQGPDHKGVINLRFIRPLP